MRLTTTQEEILSTLKRVGEPMQFHAVLTDLRERVATGAAHPATSRDMRDVLEEWSGLADACRIRRVSRDSTLWELVPQVAFVEDEQETHQTSEE